MRESGGRDIGVSMYDGITPDPEAERLKEAAMVADTVSLMHTRDAWRLLDIGAGDSATFGQACIRRGQQYYAVEPRSGAVQGLLQAGINAKEGTALDTGVASNSVDAVHARFVFGWLGPTERRLALEEMSRVLEHEGTITVLDYDWGVVEGPPELLNLVKQGTRLLRQQGFDPLWGRQVPEWLPETLRGVIPEAEVTQEQTSRQSLYVGRLADVLDGGFIGHTKESLVAALAQLGNQQLVDDIETKYALLCEYAAQHPDEEVRLPDIVGVTMRMRGNPHHPERVVDPEFRQGEDYDVVLEGPGWIVARVQSPAMIQAVRQVQARSYVAHELVGADAINEDGVLCQEIEPAEQVARSVYIATCDTDGNIRSVARIILPDERQHIDSLPEVARLTAETRAKLEQWLDTERINARRVVEVSGLAKNMSGGDIHDVIRTIIGLTRAARGAGYEATLMGLRENETPLIQSILGHEVIRIIGGPHVISLPGVNDDITYQTVVANLRSLFSKVQRHNEKLLERANTPTSLRSAILEIVQRAMERDRQEASRVEGWYI